MSSVKSRAAVTVFLILAMFSLVLSFIYSFFAGPVNILLLIFNFILPLINIITLAIIYFVFKNIRYISVNLVLQTILIVLSSSGFIQMFSAGFNAALLVDAIINILFGALVSVLLLLALLGKISKTYAVIFNGIFLAFVSWGVLIYIIIKPLAGLIGGSLNSLTGSSASTFALLYLEWISIYYVFFCLAELFIALGIKSPDAEGGEEAKQDAVEIKPAYKAKPSPAAAEPSENRVFKIIKDMYLLKNEGVISEEEFNFKKREILDKLQL